MAVSVVDIFQSGGNFMWVILIVFAFGIAADGAFSDSNNPTAPGI